MSACRRSATAGSGQRRYEVGRVVLSSIHSAGLPPSLAPAVLGVEESPPVVIARQISLDQPAGPSQSQCRTVRPPDGCTAIRFRADS